MSLHAPRGGAALLTELSCTSRERARILGDTTLENNLDGTRRYKELVNFCVDRGIWMLDTQFGCTASLCENFVSAELAVTRMASVS